MKKYCFLLLIPVAFLLQGGCGKDGGSYASSSSGNSTAGSLARFVLVGNYLYTVNQQNLKTYNVTDPANPKLESTINVGPDIETVFPYKGNLYVGSNTTAYRYSISNPAQPVKGGQATYFIPGRDPIVANDTLAYSTVRNTGGNGGRLNVINVQNPEVLTVVSQIQLSTNPYGLGLADSALYVCEQNGGGLKIYNVKGAQSRSPAIRMVVNNGETYFDVIPYGDLLYAWIGGGNSIFDISNRMNPVLLSKTKN